eukprot:gnl/Spiro4/15435_TR8304_c0_g2_i1.p1 gnl/Spiro4/15435_TR8304_c0_g2~~gnl/Spiro4/15435_TR8304_c0_g2_i1.p1  ORF type:complete len:880 (-),score=381.47 gnl/Spiro4/15435_TR8304_c0_g2_i1:99-2651(-)
MDQENSQPNTRAIPKREFASPARIMKTASTTSQTLSKASSNFASPPPSPHGSLSRSKTLPRSFSNASGKTPLTKDTFEAPPPRPAATTPQRVERVLFKEASNPAALPSLEDAEAPLRPAGSSAPAPTAQAARPGSRTARKAQAEENVKVVCRCRPMNERERLESLECGENVVSALSARDEVYVNNASKGKTRTFRFDKVYGCESTQEDVFLCSVKPIVEQVLDGFNCTIFAYGQTGTGKTHTMEGSPSADGSQLGVIPRAIRMIFDVMAAARADFTVKASYVELYNEELSDLLAARARPLRIFDTQQKSTEIKGVEEVIVQSADDIHTIMQIASTKRRVAQTCLNDRSSRSHAIFTVTVQTREAIADGEDMIKTGKLNLVDLAGSENIERSGAVKQRAKEAGHINTSLLTLGRVINALTEGENYVPYRDSKLTRILQESLGGRAQTCIIATISPTLAFLEETINTLDYASRAKNIKNKPEVNMQISKTALIKEYELEIQRLRNELEATRDGSGPAACSGDLRELQDEIERLKAELEDAHESMFRKDAALSDAELRRAALQAQLEQQQASTHEVDRLKAELAQLHDEAGRARADVTQAQGEARRLQAQLDEAQREAVHAQVARAELDLAKQSMQAEMEALRSQAHETMRARAEGDVAQKALQAEFDYAVVELKRTKSALADLESEKRKAAQSLLEKTQEMQRVDAQLQATTDRLRSAEADAADVRQELEGARAAAARNDINSAQTAMELSSLADSVALRDEQMRVLAADNSYLKDELERLRQAATMQDQEVLRLRGILQQTMNLCCGGLAQSINFTPLYARPSSAPLSCVASPSPRSALGGAPAAATPPNS